MTLDEHIKKAEEDAKQAEFDTEWGIGNYFIDRTEALEYAKECRQLVEWLKELKEYRKNYTCFNCYNSSASFNDYPCCECRRCFKALDGIKDHYEEVNVDADSN